MPRLDKDTYVRTAIAEALIPAGKRDVLLFDGGHKKAIPGFEEIRDHARFGRDVIGEQQEAAAAKAAAEKEVEDAPTLKKLAPHYLRDRERGRNDRGKELKKLKAK